MNNSTIKGQGLEAHILYDLKSKCLDKAFEVCRQNEVYKVKDGVRHCYSNNVHDIKKAYKSLLRIVT